MTGDAAFGTTVAGYTGTIPRLLDRAASRDPSGIWLRSDSMRLSFAQAAGEVGVVAEALADAGIGHGDLILVTARTTPAYLLAWLALASLGAVTVPVNPASSEAEFAGLIRQVEPLAVLTDPELEPAINVAVQQAGKGGRRVRQALLM